MLTFTIFKTCLLFNDQFVNLTATAFAVVLPPPPRSLFLPKLNKTSSNFQREMIIITCVDLLEAKLGRDYVKFALDGTRYIAAV